MSSFLSRSAAIVGYASRVILMCLAVSSLAAAKPVHLAFIFSDGNSPGTIKAYKALLDERPDLKGQVSISFLTESVFDDVKGSDFTSADVLLLDIMNQQMLDRFNEKHKVDLIKAVRSHGGKGMGIGDGRMP
jgi:cobaltochelatase CobN